MSELHVVKALFDYSESETSLLNLTVLLQTSPAVNANPTVRMDLNREPVWPKLVPDSCVIKQSLQFPYLGFRNTQSLQLDHPDSNMCGK